MTVSSYGSRLVCLLLLLLSCAPLAAAGLDPPPTTTTLTASPNPVPMGQPVTFTATVSPADATGVVAFSSEGGGNIGCLSVAIVGGTATCTATFGDNIFGFPVSSLTITATYGGDGTHAGSASAPYVENITKPPATVILTASKPTGQAMWDAPVFYVTVMGGGGTGTVTFLSDGQVLCPAQAMVFVCGNANTLPAGTHTIVATYSGDRFVAPSQSAPLTLVLGPPPPLKQYFAEGATGGFFQTDVGVLNGSKTDVAHLKATLLPESGVPVVLDFTLDPLARRSLDLNALLGSGQGVS